MVELEKRFADLDISESSNLAQIFNNSRFNGWYKFCLETKENEKEFIDTIIRFRLPSSLKIYGDVLRNFTQSERKIGLHRLLIGKDLQEEAKNLLKDFDNPTELLDTLSDDEVSEILDRMKNIIVLDCNKIPYLHIRALSIESEKTMSSFENKIKEFILDLPDYLKILHNVLNEKVSIKEATEQSQKIIFNELD